MTEDKNKGIANIEYNHLNLPTEVQFGTTDKISYLYEATGKKLEKNVMENQTTITTQYAGNVIYQNDVLQFFHTPEGYAAPKNASDLSQGFDYVYQYKDHLGNVRLSYTKNPGFDGSSDTTEQLFFDTLETSSGWDSEGALYGRSATIATDKYHSGSTSAKIANTANNQYHYAHSNTWVNIDNTTDTEYTFSGWFYTDAPHVRLVLFMKTDEETGYYTKVHDTGVIKDQKNQWVYVARKTIVPQEIDQINLRIETHGGNAGAAWFDDLKIERKGAAKTVIVQENNYYPFGLEHKGYNNVVNGVENNYMTFQGQERTEDLGLNVLEYKYRMHDPAIGRFWQIDPLAENFPHNGTYNFSENRVIDAIELEGLESYVVTGRAFIPQNKLSNPTPWGKSDSYKGDNRNYYSATSTAFRTEQSVRLNFDNNTSETLSNTASPTIGLDKNGNEVQRSSAGEAGTVSSNIEKGGVNLEFSATNKLSKSENPLTPSIDGQFNISITPNEDGTFNFNVDANVDGFPAYEIWVTDETNGGSFLLFGRNPIESGEGPLSLYGNGEHSGTTSGNSETKRAANGKVEFKDKKNDID